MVRYIRTSGLVLLMAAITLAPVAPVYAQAAQSGQQQGQATTPPAQASQDAQPQQSGQANPIPTVTVQQPGPPPPPAAAKKISDTGSREYSYGKPWFPTILAPYTQMEIPMPDLVNTPDIDGFIQNGKLTLSLQDAVALALKNNLDIQVQRYNPWIAEAAVLKQRVGPNGTFDPLYQFTAGVQTSNSPVSNPFISGTGSASLSAIASHTFSIQNTYSQSFSTGTAFQYSLSGSRQTTGAANIFNPAVQTSMNVGVSQQLLRGFGKLANDRFLYVAQNSKLISDATFKQSVLADITQVELDYWELVFARQNVTVQQQVLATAQRNLDDDRKQVQIGTMAPLDVTSAESNVAGAQQGLIQAQTTLLLDQTVLLSVITKNPVAQNLTNIEIVPTDNTYIPEVTENLPLDQAVKEALTNRPDYQESLIQLKSDDINVRADRNELLPTLTLSGSYGWSGLAGIESLSGSAIPGTFTADLQAPIVDQNGNVIANEFLSVPVSGASTTSTTGLGTALSDLFTNKFPTYGASLNFTLPVRNRSAQADSITALLTQRQDLTRLQFAQNQIVVDVRTAQINLQQARASLEAAQATVKYQQQAVEATEKEFQFGTSSAFTVVQQQQLLATDAGALVRAEVNLVEDKVQFDRAMGRTFTVNNISVESARNQMNGSPLIPGTMSNGQLASAPLAGTGATGANGSTTQTGNGVPKNRDQN
jgi:outer membrane protein